MRGPRLIHLRAPLSRFYGEKWKSVNQFAKSENNDIDALKVQSIKNYISLLERPTIIALVATFDAKSSMTRNCGNCAWLSGTGLLISRGEPTANATVEIFEKTHGLHFCKFHISLFLSVLIKTNHTAHMYGCIKTLKHNVRTTLWLACHGCKILTHEQNVSCKTHTHGWTARFTIRVFITFQSAKNRTQRNRRAKWCEVQIRTVARKSSIRG